VASGEVIVFIPARGGSKGIPKKNLQAIGAETLIGRSIATALRLREFFVSVRVVVSTDDQEIAAEALARGAEVHSRPERLAQDSSSSEEALLHFLDHDEIECGPETTVAMVQCTSPSTTTEDLLSGIAALKFGFDSAFIGVENHYWLYEDTSSGYRPLGHKLDKRPSRQTIKPQVHETGAGYFFTVSSFQKFKFRLHGRITCVRVNQLGYVDIDEPEDLTLARKLFS